MPCTVKVRVRESALVSKTPSQFSRWITAFGRNRYRSLSVGFLAPWSDPHRPGSSLCSAGGWRPRCGALAFGAALRGNDPIRCSLGDGLRSLQIEGQHSKS